MKKRIFMALLAAVSCFALAGCGKDKDKDEDPKPAKLSTETVYNVDDNGVSVSFPDSKTDPTCVTTYEYTFDGDKVTSNTITFTYSDMVYAAAAEASYDPSVNDGVESIERKGNSVVVKMKVPEGLTKDVAIMTCEAFQ